jgi:hypothetical protein
MISLIGFHSSYFILYWVDETVLDNIFPICLLHNFLMPIGNVFRMVLLGICNQLAIAIWFTVNNCLYFALAVCKQPCNIWCVQCKGQYEGDDFLHSESCQCTYFESLSMTLWWLQVMPLFQFATDSFNGLLQRCVGKIG